MQLQKANNPPRVRNTELTWKGNRTERKACPTRDGTKEQRQPLSDGLRHLFIQLHRAHNARELITNTKAQSFAKNRFRRQSIKFPESKKKTRREQFSEKLYHTSHPKVPKTESETQTTTNKKQQNDAQSQTELTVEAYEQYEYCVSRVNPEQQYTGETSPTESLPTMTGKQHEANHKLLMSSVVANELSHMRQKPIESLSKISRIQVLVH